MKLETIIQRAKRQYWLKKLDHAYDYLRPRASNTPDSVALSLISLSMVEIVATEQYVRDYCARNRVLNLKRL